MIICPYRLFKVALAQWFILDFAAEAVTPITGIPNVQVFNRLDIIEFEGGLYLPTVEGAYNHAHSKYKPDTGNVEKALPDYETARKSISIHQRDPIIEVEPEQVEHYKKEIIIDSLNQLNNQ